MPRPGHYLKAGTTQSAAPNAGNANFTNAFDSRYIRIYSPTVDCFVKFGSSAPTAEATDIPIMAGFPEIFDTGDGNVYGAVYCSGSTTVYATPMK